MLGGAVVVVPGIFFVVAGVASVASGYGGGHAGGWTLLPLGLGLMAVGIWVCRAGRRSYLAIERSVESQ
jgi:hypothetical protein